MGELTLHDLSKFGCNIFVETGTGKGHGLEYACKFGFKKLYSIEINSVLHNENVGKFPKNVKLINDNSIDGLKTVLKIIGEKGKTLFFLDAHFPGADFQLGSYDDVMPDEKKYPLSEELGLIWSARAAEYDSFIIDDLQLYEPDADYELKAPEEFLKKHRRHINFDNIFCDTHNVERIYRHQGVLIATPKES